jgi:hypothetical protein
MVIAKFITNRFGSSFKKGGLDRIGSRFGGYPTVDSTVDGGCFRGSIYIMAVGRSGFGAEMKASTAGPASISFRAA